jgi:CHAT domain-containing protein
VSLAAAMQHLGWRHVIGTLWTVGDDDASEVAESFYRKLIRDGRPVPEASARALHAAVLALRDSDPRRTARWARFVHLGP